jgi:hypothetical protein
MAAPAITASTRYYRPGTSKIYFCPTIANIASPTRGELNAGTDISPEVAAVSGWAPSRNFLDAPDLLSAFVPKVSAGLEAGDSTINMYASSNSVDARSLLPMDTTGYIVMLYEGDVAGRKMNVFPIKVGSDAQEVDLGNVAQLVFSFAVTSNPSRNVTIPA